MSAPNQLKAQLIHEKATSMWVILADKGQGPTLIKDGMVSRPYFNTNRKVAEDTARLISKQHPRWKLEVRTLVDAWQVLLKAHPTFEKDLIAGLENLRATKI